ncbi:hypothetical protein GGI25_000563 [Coemansia spiralis]|uniref:Phosphatidic acid phosphatase type 2/haloperoxidase domain-containing protein n=2 Tax=Coemansia TaxID=4863 RepID=A0A9W8GCG9_9FUNG|nr:phosphatidic acid phosphatase type 2/haloperoxidase [Coemansia spiralis]KAJ1996024.1 hypothetical protein EDC05_000392 [Coemansia umbellata]KAJ2625467.1 hypothetical protein GGI26_000607 [Coemansia sp. RSA 1358]KAJ2680590.1 hypothetical protein GGI25_000563 [Coemansia spiralis]
MSALSRLLSKVRLPAVLVKSYVPDWLVTLASLLVWMYLSTAKPHYQSFSVNDKTIAYPYVLPDQQTVTVPTLFFISIVVPAAVIAGISFGIRRNSYDLHVGILGLLLSVTLTLMFTNALKNVVGRPRPDFLARCLLTPPKEPLVDPPQGLSTVDICTQTDIATLNEGFRSFPSGHTSLSFGGMTYLMYYLAGKLHLFDGQGHSYKPFVVFTPFLIAAVVGATRVADYWHHPTDVLFGAMIGIVTATFSYFQYYPILISPNCDIPYNIRERPTPMLPIHANSYYPQDPNQQQNPNQQQGRGEQNHISLSITDHSSRPRASTNPENASNNSENNNSSTSPLLSAA